MTTIVALNYKNDLTVEVDRVLYVTGVDVERGDKIVIHDGIAIASKDDKVVIIGSVNGEYSFIYKEDEFVFNLNVIVPYLMKVLERTLTAIRR